MSSEDVTVPKDVKPGTRVAIGRGNQSRMSWAQTGIVVKNPGGTAFDGFHRLKVRFTTESKDCEWEYYVDIEDLILVK